MACLNANLDAEPGRARLSTVQGQWSINQHPPRSQVSHRSSQMPCPVDALPRPLLAHLAQLAVDPAQPLDAEFFDLPSTDLAQRSIAFVRSLIPEWAVNHSFRTYAFGLAIAHYAGWDQGDAASRLGFDRETLFLACFLHEIGFEQQNAPESRLSLEFWAAIKARDWILQQGPDAFPREMTLADCADECFEAIALHSLEPAIPRGRVRLLPALCALGALQDLLGSLTAFIHEDTIQIILSRWPRLGYVDGLAHVTRNEVAKKPGCIFEICEGTFMRPMYSVPCFEGKQGMLGSSVPLAMGSAKED